MPRRKKQLKKREIQKLSLDELAKIAQLTPWQKIMVRRYLIYKLKRARGG